MFIAFEGIDGSGKSTQVDLLTKHLCARGRIVYTSGEPTISPVGKLLREMLHGENCFLTEEVESEFIGLLITTDRFHHVFNKYTGIQRHLTARNDVILDRYYDSTFAYNDNTGEIHSFNISYFPKPDIKIYLNVSPQLAMGRLANNMKCDRYENLDKLSKVANRYSRLIEDTPDDWVVIDGSKSQEETHYDICKVIDLKILQDDVIVNSNLPYTPPLRTCPPKPKCNLLVSRVSNVLPDEVMEDSDSELATVPRRVSSVMIEKLSKAGGFTYRTKGSV